MRTARFSGHHGGGGAEKGCGVEQRGGVCPGVRVFPGGVFTMCSLIEILCVVEEKIGLATPA